MQYYEKSGLTGARILNRVEKFFDFHPQLRRLFDVSEVPAESSLPETSPAPSSSSNAPEQHQSQDPSFACIVEQLVKEPVVLYKEKLNYKLPGGDGFRPHQDAQAGWDRYGHTLHFSLLFAVDDATIENGCLELVRGRHKEGLLGPMWEELPQDVIDQMEWIPMPTKPGDVLIFDSFVPHRSKPNMTSTSRRALYITYNLASEGDFRSEYFHDKRISFPPDIERQQGIEYRYRI